MPGQSPAGQAPTKGVGLPPLFVGASPAREILGGMPGQSPAGQAPTRGLGLSGLRRSEPCSRGFGECPGNRLQGRLLRGAWGFPVFVGASPAREILSCRSLSSLRSPLMGFPDLPLVLSPFTFHLSPFTSKNPDANIDNRIRRSSRRPCAHRLRARRVHSAASAGVCRDGAGGSGGLHRFEFCVVGG